MNPAVIITMTLIGMFIILGIDTMLSHKRTPKCQDITGADFFNMYKGCARNFHESGVRLTHLPAGKVYTTHAYHGIKRTV